MANVVFTRTVCDRHQMKHNKTVDGETVVVKIGDEEFEVDWCPEDRKRMTDLLLAELRDYARPVNPKRAPKSHKPVAAHSNGEVVALPTATTAPAEPSPAKPSRALAKGKLNKRAKKTPSNKERRFQCLWCEWQPYTTPVGMMLHGTSKHGLESLSMVEVFGTTCPLCGEETPHSIGTHGQNVHNGMNVSEVFLQAKRDGDPHGIVAKVLAKGHPLDPAEVIPKVEAEAEADA